MQKLIFTFILFSIALSVNGQDSTAVKDSRPPLYYLYQNNFNLANRYNDGAAAKEALYSMINMDPANDSLRFTLAYFYFEAQQYPSAILVCMDVLQLNPKHTGALEMSAISYENIGLKEKALTNYEQLYNYTDDLEALYKLTFVQYDLKRYIECLVNIEILLEKEEIDERTMVFQLEDEAQKEFSFRVAVLNLRGLVKKDQGDIAGAKEDWQQALEIAPDFAYAKNNLAELNK